VPCLPKEGTWPGDGTDGLGPLGSLKMKAIGGGKRVAVLAIALAFGLLVAACGGQSAAKGAKRGASPTQAAAARKRTRQALTRTRQHNTLHSLAICPLTGLPAPGGHVPEHAAVAVKVENLPQARPQWGLDTADVVFEEPVEGGITRFIAVYDCGSASRIEPVRSGRFDDPLILEPLGKLLFAYAGAIQPVVNEIGSSRSLLEDVGIFKAPQAYWRDPSRYAPHNLVTSTAALYAAAKQLGYVERPPHPIFSYGKAAPGGTPAAVINIHYPIDTTTWTWRPSAGVYYRSYSDTGPAVQGDGKQVTASNVIVMLVPNYETPWVEDPTGAHEYVMGLKGSGPAWVFRDGVQYFGKWERPLLDQPTVFLEANGTKVTLTPGNTWVEYVPLGSSVSVEP